MYFWNKEWYSHIWWVIEQIHLKEPRTFAFYDITYFDLFVVENTLHYNVKYRMQNVWPAIWKASDGSDCIPSLDRSGSLHGIDGCSFIILLSSTTIGRLKLFFFFKVGSFEVGLTEIAQQTITKYFSVSTHWWCSYLLVHIFAI